MKMISFLAVSGSLNISANESRELSVPVKNSESALDARKRIRPNTDPLGELGLIQAETLSFCGNIGSYDHSERALAFFRHNDSSSLPEN